ncbi:3-isopropylmalate dehydratase small subunit [Marinicella litoralis]|uniref:3-isopropylmalate dehydratase n=1 Tax=Marinicella litoralis TaxID=644220 RepID=A0A4R6XQM1_9GAMM|nr:3-isopropylmalate dehydratase small subunit [Marinicella litoralis]TDR20520.1 3-isopropylmalate/(R)-2-methylmalate dehydratase small subunit [Marinicella litoralis]
MKPNIKPAITTIKGLCAPMMINDIDTDIIIPAQHLTQTSKTGYGQHAFARLKQADVDFVLNQPQYQNAKVLITGDNFGCGSSREHAVWAIQELGFAAIIAPSFADIFSNNARKNGLVLIEQSIDICQQLAELNKFTPQTIEIDLLYSHAKTAQLHFDFMLNPFFQYCITQGHSELDYLMSHQAATVQHKKQSINRQLFINYPQQLGTSS